MKLIRVDTNLYSFAAGKQLTIERPELTPPYILLNDDFIYGGSNLEAVFEALIKFLSGREVLFDVDKFVQSLERKEGSKL